MEVSGKTANNLKPFDAHLCSEYTSDLAVNSMIKSTKILNKKRIVA